MKLTQQQFDTLKRSKPLFDALGAVSTLLEDQADLSSLSNAYNEAVARLNDKRTEEQRLDARIAAVAGIETDARALLDKARRDADDIRANANIEADKTKKDGVDTADGILERAKTTALNIKKAAQAELPAIELNIEKKRDEFTQLANSCDDKRKELDDINRDKNAALEHIQVLLKGKA